MTAASNLGRDTIPASRQPVLEGDAPSMGSSLEHLRDDAGRIYRRAKEKAIEQEHKFEDYVKEHPVKSVLVAAGVGAGIGVLAGFLMSRR